MGVSPSLFCCDSKDEHVADGVTQHPYGESDEDIGSDSSSDHDEPNDDSDEAPANEAEEQEGEDDEEEEDEVQKVLNDKTVLRVTNLPTDRAKLQRCSNHLQEHIKGVMHGKVPIRGVEVLTDDDSDESHAIISFFTEAMAADVLDKLEETSELKIGEYSLNVFLNAKFVKDRIDEAERKAKEEQERKEREEQEKQERKEMEAKEEQERERMRIAREEQEEQERKETEAREEQERKETEAQEEQERERIRIEIASAVELQTAAEATLEHKIETALSESSSSGIQTKLKNASDSDIRRISFEQDIPSADVLPAQMLRKLLLSDASGSIETFRQPMLDALKEMKERIASYSDPVCEAIAQKRGYVAEQYQQGDARYYLINNEFGFPAEAKYVRVWHEQNDK